MSQSEFEIVNSILDIWKMAAASNAYDANVMTETAAGGDSLLG